MVNWPDIGELNRTCFPGPAGQVECLIEMPDESPKGIMLICHPHPQFGGTMDNKVVYSLARSGVSAGWTSLRFNYRGVGKSAGAYDDGVGELEDAVSVLLTALSYQPGRIILAGFSFGAALALRLSGRINAERVISVAPPLGYFENETLPEPECPWLVIHGDQDEVVSCADTLSRLEALQRKPEIQILEGAGHFFHGRLTDLRNIVDTFLA